MIFFFKLFLKSASKPFSFGYGAEIRFWSCNFDAVARSSIVFRNSISAGRTVMAASRLLGAAAVRVTVILSFAAESCNRIVLSSTGKYSVQALCIVVRSSTGKYFVQAL